jgi:hypothetical protein
MKRRITSRYQAFQWVTFVLSLVFPVMADAAVPSSINIQGTLQAPDGGPLTGTYPCQVRFLDQNAGGQDLGSVTQTIQLSETGRFSIQVTPPQALLDAVQPGYELAVDVDGDGFDAGEVFPNLVTIQSVPFALLADESESLGGRPADDYATDAELAAGLTTASTSGHDHDSVYWGLTGNGAEFGQFLGTTNERSLELRANNQTALRLIPNATSPNVIGGYQQNNLFAGVAGGVIAGGGTSNYHGGGSFSRNLVSGNYGAIVGGVENKAGEYAFVGGGDGNTAAGRWSAVGGGQLNSTTRTYTTVGGGYGNQAYGRGGTVAGGELNVVSGINGTVGGGSHNEATGVSSTVPGGAFNTASGNDSVVPGGVSNDATGVASLAAGQDAAALHDHTFVWSDGLFGEFASTTNNQFAVHADNGVYFARNAGESKIIHWGERFRDNGILAWAKMAAIGTTSQDFGVGAVFHVLGSGVYSITVTDAAANASSLVPVAIAEVENPPNSADDVRIVSINQTGGQRNNFEVYINDGNWNLVDEDFVFMLTGR